MVIAKVMALILLAGVVGVGLLSLAGAFRFWYWRFEQTWIPEGEQAFVRALVAMLGCGVLIFSAVLFGLPAVDAICAWVVA